MIIDHTARTHARARERFGVDAAVRADAFPWYLYIFRIHLHKRDLHNTSTHTRTQTHVFFPRVSFTRRVGRRRKKKKIVYRISESACIFFSTLVRGAKTNYYNIDTRVRRCSVHHLSLGVCFSSVPWNIKRYFCAVCVCVCLFRTHKRTRGDDRILYRFE